MSQKLSRTFKADAILARSDLPAEVQTGAEIIKRRWIDSPLTFSRPETCREGGWGPTKERQLEIDGKLNGFLDGGIRRVFADSLYSYLLDCLVESYPVEAPLKRREAPLELMQAIARRRIAPALEPRPVKRPADAPPKGRPRTRKPELKEA